MSHTIHILNNFVVNSSILFMAATLSSWPGRSLFGASLRLHTPVPLGVGAGLTAILLMLNPFTYAGAAFDLRIIPFIIAFWFGGTFSLCIAILLFWSIRLFLMGGYPLSPMDLSLLSLLVFFVRTRGVRSKRHVSTLLHFTALGNALFLLMVYPLFSTGQLLFFCLSYLAMVALGTYSVSTWMLTLKRLLGQANAEYHRARTDALTGLANRYRLDETLTHLTKNASTFGLLLIDIDRFKDVNDTYGHEVGDDVLRSIGELLEHASGPDALVGRFGGEEFLVILPKATPAILSSVAEHIRICVATHPFPTRGGNVSITVSIGACHAVNQFPEDALTLADVALYTAKKSGRNRTFISENH